ncbi:putative tubulin-specific chaperone c [Teratosphaeria nubilosa]|uniref:Putative tubulin-specific chaperone c n=1 Tax=Teratosphaeria nubilosa TaxID=161662 RepID=A0A6G1KUJ0_9PEZI|nr:putative tubulin-specific chaperone c [Teratosphaeria nubilosa]
MAAASPDSNANREDGSELTRAITNAENFFQYFQQEIAALQEQMNKLQNQSISGSERTDACEHCQAGIARLSDTVKDASSIIPAYDQRNYGEAIKALTAKLQETKTTFAPKPKFSFRKGSTFTANKNASAISLNDAAEMANQQRKLESSFKNANVSSTESSMAPTPAHLRSPAPEREDEGSPTIGESATAVGVIEPSMVAPDARQVHRPSLWHSDSVKIAGHSDVHIILPPSASHATSSGTLANLEHCVVDLSWPTEEQHFASLTAKHVKDSLIICGRVSGPIHLTGVTNSVILVASRQFRMHESHNTHVYLQTSSRPIIEDCTGIAFAPLPQQYAAGGDGQGQAEEWKEVDDFKWLKSEPSPNWRVLQPQSRVRDEVWRDVVRGGPETGLQEILKAVNLPE